MKGAVLENRRDRDRAAGWPHVLRYARVPALLACRGPDLDSGVARHSRGHGGALQWG